MQSHDLHFFRGIVIQLQTFVINQSFQVENEVNRKEKKHGERWRSQFDIFKVASWMHKKMSWYRSQVSRQSV